MFENKVTISDDFLIVGRKKVLWSQIVGIREQNSPTLQKISNKFPRAEIFLKGGSIITISNLNRFVYMNSNSKELKDDSYESSMQIIRDRSDHLNPIFNNWIEWRLISPILVVEIIAFLIGFVKGLSIEQIGLLMISFGVTGTIVGWIWERSERKKYCA